MEANDQIESQVILVRHAKSAYNLVYTNACVKGASDDELKNLSADKQFRDCELSQEGFEQ